MKPMQFVATRDRSLYIYRYAPNEDRPVEVHWPGLFANETFESGATPFEYAVNNNNTEEVVVYLGFAWRLTANLRRYAIPNYYRDEAAQLLGKSFEFIDWEYEVDAEELDPAMRDKGFVLGRTPLVYGRSTPTQRPAEAGLFELGSFRDLVGLLRAVLCDASAELTVLAVEPGAQSKSRLLKSLRRQAGVFPWSKAKPPRLKDVLRDRDIFVDVSVGCDLGYYDSIIVASHTDLTEQIYYLIDDYARRITEYERRAETLPDIEAFLTAMEDLSGVSRDAVSRDF